MAKKRILFVCMGNICRSPAAEGIFRRLVEERGLSDQVEIDSAGTIGYHAGDPPDRRMTLAARKRGVELSQLVARQFTPRDFEGYDMILAMDQQNLAAISNLDRDRRHGDRVHLYLNFSEKAKGQDVPDPYYGGDQGFENVLDLLEDAAEAVLDHLMAGKESDE